MKNKSITRYSTTTLAFCAALVFASKGMSADKDTLDAADVKFVKQEAATGMAAVKLAGLGAQKAVRADVKAFAEMIVTDHTKANEELTKLAATKGVELSAVIDPKHAETFQKLEKTESADFDKEFLNVAVSGHKKCVSNFEDAAKDSKDADVKMWAEKTLPTLKAHLAQAQELSSGSSTNSAANSPTPATKNADNTARNVRDRNPGTLTPMDQGGSEADVNTTAQIRKEIIAGKDMSVNAQNVKIITNTGKVTLRGPVNSDAEKRLIGEIADRVAHAENVTNQLEVRSDASN
jgi:putative membrane protein